MTRKRKKDPLQGLISLVGTVVIGGFVLWNFAPGVLGGIVNAIAIPVVGMLAIGGIVLFIRSKATTAATPNDPSATAPPKRRRSGKTEISPSPALSAAIDDAMKTERPRIKPNGFSEDTFRRMDWLVFEHFVVALFGELGFKAKKTSSGADGGVDIELRGVNDADHETPKALVQCKTRSNSMVGVDKVRELYGVLSARKVSRGILVSNTGYTDDARAFGKQAAGLMLGDLEWVLKQVDKLPPSTKSEMVSKFLLPDFDIPSCPQCEVKLVPRSGKSGRFWGCPNFPRGCRTKLHWRSIDG